MWTLAASLSAQLQHIRDSLYESTRRMLESLESKDNNTEFTDIEHVQARVLLLIYDFMRTNHQRGWMSAGRCFRLLQLMRLYEIDAPDRNNAKEPESWIKTEEKRRTFWMAYTLDRFISIRHEWPLTLNEQVVSVTSFGNSMCKWLMQLRSPPVCLLQKRCFKAVNVYKWASYQKR